MYPKKLFLLLLAGSLSGAAGACGNETKDVVASTQVLLSIDADLTLRGRADQLHAALWVNRPTGWTLRSQVDVTGTNLHWPLDIPIVASRAGDEALQFEVILEARLGTQQLAQTRVVTNFVSGQHVAVAANLASCLGHTDDFVCSGDDCHGASCTVCSTLGTCLPVGAQAPVPVVDPLDGGAIVPAGDGATQLPPNTQGDGAVQTDAASPPLADGGVSDAQVTLQPDGAVATLGVCPVEEVCKPPYACVPTPLGYTCRGQFADWPMPDAMPGAKVAPSYSTDGQVVVDNITGLQWQLGIPAIYPGCTGSDTNSGQPMGALCSRIEATAYCAGLVQGGHDDWRLPTLIEMSSLFDTQRDNGGAGIDDGSFGDSDFYDFICASFYAGGASEDWIVNYYARVTDPESADPNQVRCVRAGNPPPFATPADRYQIDATADTVTDRATTLIWQRTVTATLYPVAEADKHCAAGYRLPTPNELLSLVDPTRSKPAIDPVAFPNTPSEFFWASLKSAAVNGVTFASGSLDTYVSMAHVRCVK